MGFIISEIPKANPIQFYELDRVSDPRYHSLPMGDDAYWLQVRGYEYKKPFFQKWQFNNQIQFQHHCSQNYGSTIKLVDKYGTVHFTWNNLNYSVFNVAGNVANVGVSGNLSVQLYTMHWNFSFANAGVPEGVYWLILSVGVDLNNTNSLNGYIRYLSEPLFIRQDHPGTVRIRYKHKANRFDLIYLQTFAEFELLVDGDVCKFIPVSSDTMYKDQTEKIRLLSSFPSEQYSLTIGGRTGIPDYLFNILNRAMSHSSVTIEGEGYVKEENAKWEISDVARYPLRWAALQLRKSSPVNSKLLVQKQAFQLWNNVGGYPFMLHTLTANATPLQATLALAKEILTPADEDVFINYLQSTVGPSVGMNGTFYRSGTGVFYQPLMTEYWSSSSPILLTSYFDLTKSNISGVGGNNVSLQFNAKYVGVRWSTGPSGVTARFGTGAFTTYTASRNYPTFGSGASASIRVYTNSNWMNTVYSGSIGISAISGSLPIGTTGIFLENNAITTINFATLFGNCLATLVTLYLNNNQITTLSSFAQAWQVLKFIDFSNNKLSSPTIDAWFNQFVIGGNAAIVANAGVGVINIEAQTPAAPPTGTSAPARTYIDVTNAWSVTTD